MDENESQVVNFERVCRLCLHEKRILTEIFESAADNNNLTIDQKIMACATIDLCKDDGLPSRICIKCLSSVNAAFDFRIQCENADKTLHEIHTLLLPSETDKDKADILGVGNNTANVKAIEETQTKKKTEDLGHIVVVKKQEKEFDQAEESSDLFYIINDPESEGESQKRLFDNDIIYCKEGVASGDSSETETYQTEEYKADFEDSNEISFTFQGNSEEKYNVVANSPENREGIGVNELKLKEKKKTAGEIRKSPCPFCNKMLTRVDEHIRLLHRNRVYICTKHDCGAEFLTLKNLQSHQLRCYDVEKAFKCPSCFKEFHRKSNFKAHIIRHNNKKDFQCQLCDRAFVDSTGLRRHFLKHHEPEQEIFVSGCCGKSFKSKEGLKKHIRKSICGIQIFQVLDSNSEAMHVDSTTIVS